MLHGGSGNPKLDTALLRSPSGLLNGRIASLGLALCCQDVLLACIQLSTRVLKPFSLFHQPHPAQGLIFNLVAGLQICSDWTLWRSWCHFSSLLRIVCFKSHTNSMKTYFIPSSGSLRIQSEHWVLTDVTYFWSQASSCATQFLPFVSYATHIGVQTSETHPDLCCF